MLGACVAMQAQTSYQILRACHPDDVKHYDNEQLRSRFMMPKVMEADKINLTYTMYDRLIFGGVMPPPYRCWSSTASSVLKPPRPSTPFRAVWACPSTAW